MKKIIIMKDKDRFMNKSNNLRNKKNEKGMWKVINNNYKIKNDIPNVIKYKNEVHIGPNKIAEAFNNSFINSVKETKNKIHQKEDPMLHYKKYIKKGDILFKFEYTNLRKIQNIIDKMKATYTSGVDTICSIVIKDISIFITPILHHIFNLNIKNNCYPDISKILKVITFLKPGKDPNNPEDYRDINLSNVY